MHVHNKYDQQNINLSIKLIKKYILGIESGGKQQILHLNLNQNETYAQTSNPASHDGDFKPSFFLFYLTELPNFGNGLCSLFYNLEFIFLDTH